MHMAAGQQHAGMAEAECCLRVERVLLRTGMHARGHGGALRLLLYSSTPAAAALVLAAVYLVLMNVYSRL
jgi:hypothetical protein